MRQHEGEGGALYIYPALFALTLALFDLVFLYACFTETLPANKRVSTSTVISYSIVAYVMSQTKLEYLALFVQFDLVFVCVCVCVFRSDSCSK